VTSDAIAANEAICAYSWRNCRVSAWITG